jgi:glucan-binding YG repeat protein
MRLFYWLNLLDGEAMAKKNTQPSIMQARVLGGFILDGVQYNPDDIIEANHEMIKQLGSSVDANASAVEHCRGMKNAVIKKHESKQPDPEESGEVEDPESEEGKEPESEEKSDPDQPVN